MDVFFFHGKSPPNESPLWCKEGKKKTWQWKASYFNLETPIISSNPSYKLAINLLVYCSFPYYWRFPKITLWTHYPKNYCSTHYYATKIVCFQPVPQNFSFAMEHPIKMDDLDGPWADIGRSLCRQDIWQILSSRPVDSAKNHWGIAQCIATLWLVTGCYVVSQFSPQNVWLDHICWV